MWLEIMKYGDHYESAVLTMLADDGYPFSFHCKSEPDNGNKTLRLVLPPGVELKSGPACFLWHRHDDRLWKLNSLVSVDYFLTTTKGGM
jgi:hypothetical protein